MPTPELQLIELPDQAAWEAWLEAHHADVPGVWLKLAKKGAPRATVTQREAVESALCFGWIDGQAGRIDSAGGAPEMADRTPDSPRVTNGAADRPDPTDDPPATPDGGAPPSSHYYRQRFTPRRARSRWSLINTQRVEVLTAAGRMRPPGLAEVAAARADGRWEAAYNQARDTVPDDLAAAIAADPRAEAFFATLGAQNRFAFIFRLGAPGSPATRAKRIARYVEMLAAGETFH